MVTTEEQLIEAFRATGDYEANPDLYTRVVHSIEQDHRYRSRVRASAVWTTGVAATLATLAAFSIQTRRLGAGVRYRIDWQRVEALETVALVMLILVLGPAIRRFGRGYATDIFGSAAETGRWLLRLLDVAYYLIFSGYILVTARLSAPMAYYFYDIGDQLEQSAIRVAGLLAGMGVLHALTLMALPLMGLVFAANRRNARLPRWITVVLVVVGVGAGWQAIGLATTILTLGSP